jgi:SAM-dependent methyltransferase
MIFRDNAIVFERAEADIYDETRPFHPQSDQLQRFASLCTFLQECKRENEQIIHLVDLGCGTGRISIALAQEYAKYRNAGYPVPPLHITCLDLSRDMLEKLDSKWRGIKDYCGNAVQIELREGDIRSLGRNGPEFDAAICHWILHVINDWRVAIYAIDQALFQSARLFLITEQSPFYDAIDGDISRVDDEIVRDFWNKFAAKCSDFSSDSLRSRLGSYVVDYRINSMFDALGWTDAGVTLNCNWNTTKSVQWFIDRVIKPRSFTNMQLHMDPAIGASTYRQVADDLTTEFSSYLMHEWTFKTELGIRMWKKKARFQGDTGELLIDVARATIGHRWSRKTEQPENIVSLWSRLIQSTWTRLHDRSGEMSIPLKGLSPEAAADALFAVIFTPQSLILSPHEKMLFRPSVASLAVIRADDLWSQLTDSIDNSDPFVICLNLSEEEVMEITSEWEKKSKVHPPLHVLPLGGEIVRELDMLNIMPSQDHSREAQAQLTHVVKTKPWAQRLLRGISKRRLLPYNYDISGPKFLLGLSQLVHAKVPITYVFPAVPKTTSDGRCTLGFMIGSQRPLSGDTTRVLWSLGDVLFSDYQDQVIAATRTSEHTTATAFRGVRTEISARASQTSSLREEVIGLLTSLDIISMRRYTVVGGYARFEEGAREILHDAQRRIIQSCMNSTTNEENYLIWGLSGQGKTFFIDQIADRQGFRKGDNYIYVNIAAADSTETKIRGVLEACKNDQQTRLILLDEIDARSSEKWPYEVIFEALDWNKIKPNGADYNYVFILAGSKPPNLDSLVEEIRTRHKGQDLLNRIPRGNWFTVPPLSTGDRLLVVLSRLRSLAAEKGLSITAVDKRALIYILANESHLSAHDLTAVVRQAIGRLPIAETHLKYDYLFDAGDENKFLNWDKDGKAMAQFKEKYLVID